MSGWGDRFSSRVKPARPIERNPVESSQQPLAARQACYTPRTSIPAQDFRETNLIALSYYSMATTKQHQISTARPTTNVRGSIWAKAGNNATILLSTAAPLAIAYIFGKIVARQGDSNLRAALWRDCVDLPVC